MDAPMRHGEVGAFVRVRCAQIYGAPAQRPWKWILPPSSQSPTVFRTPDNAEVYLAGITVRKSRGDYLEGVCCMNR